MATFNFVPLRVIKFDLREYQRMKEQSGREFMILVYNFSFKFPCKSTHVFGCIIFISRYWD